MSAVGSGSGGGGAGGGAEGEEAAAAATATATSAASATHTPSEPPPTGAALLAALPPSVITTGAACFKGRPITLQAALRAEMYSALGGAGTYDLSELTQRTVVHVCNTPFDAAPEQVLAFFPPEHAVPLSSVFLLQRFDGKSAGQAFLCYPSAEAAEAAAGAVRGQEVEQSTRGVVLVSKTGQPLLPRKLDAAVVQRHMLSEALTRPPPESARSVMGPNGQLFTPPPHGKGRESNAPDVYLRVKGVPYETREEHLMAYFAEFGPSKAHVVVDGGKVVGE